MHLSKRFVVGRKIPFVANNLFYRKSFLPSFNVLIVMTTYGGLLSFIALYGREIGIQNSAFFFLIFALGIATSRFFAGKSFDKKGPRNILTICLGLLMLGFPLLVLLRNEAGFYLSAIIIGFGIGVVFPTFQAIINNLADATHRGAANSTLYTALDIGMGLGMVLSGIVAQHLSISAVFLGSSLVSCVGLVFFRKFVLGYYENNRG
jgi:MFS family permease